MLIFISTSAFNTGLLPDRICNIIHQIMNLRHYTHLSKDSQWAGGRFGRVIVCPGTEFKLSMFLF